MGENNKVINYMTPAELAAVIQETGNTVYEIAVIDGKPVIHAALRVVNARTGETIPGGLPFSVVLFKRPGEKNFSNIAIGTIVPVAELDIRLPRDYFNFCNQRLRFMRVFPLDERSFVIQMDLILHNATHEYVKFGFGLWGALFSQILYELIGQGRESLVAAAEAYSTIGVTSNYVATDSSVCEVEPEMQLPMTAETVARIVNTPQHPENELNSPSEINLAESEKSAAPDEEVTAQALKAEGPFSLIDIPLLAAETAASMNERLLAMADPAEGKEIEGAV
jgi:hypothetical protein